MSNYINKITESLKQTISELVDNPSDFLNNPHKDFSRNRKINLKTLIGITLNSGGCTMSKELLEYFDFDADTPTVSAFTQQRAKVSSDAFKYLFETFTARNLPSQNTYRGYGLIACDGSNLTIASNPNDSATLWKQNQYKSVSNHLHLNAFYDVLNRTYVDVLIQTASEYQEQL